MRRQRNKVCAKRPADALPDFRKSCTGCDKTSKDKRPRSTFKLKWKERGKWLDSMMTFWSREAAVDHAWLIGCKKRSKFRIYEHKPGGKKGRA